MLKNILNLNGVLELTSLEQKSINGGIRADQCYASISQATCADVGGVWNNNFQKCLVTVVPDGEGYQYIGCPLRP